MDNLLAILMIAVIVEAITEWAKLIIKDGKPNQWMIVSLVVALVLTLTSGVDLFAEIGLVFNLPYIGSALTGIFLSRGSNYIFELAEKLKRPPVLSAPIVTDLQNPEKDL